MDPISTLNQVMLLLRQQLAEKSQRREQTSSGRETLASTRRGTTLPHDNSQAAIRARIDTLRAAGVTSERQLLRAAIESLMLHEFGRQLSNDPDFQRMTDYVCECLEEAPQASEMRRQLLAT
jgi:hypothetical protein